jgi:uncharacterized Zn finger protein (UPF0148 family)
MQDLTITCPECGTEVAVTESLAAPLVEASKKEYERKLAEKNKELRDQALEMEKRRNELAGAEAALDETIELRTKEAAGKLAADAERRVRAEIEADLSLKAVALKKSEELLKAIDPAHKYYYAA